MERMLCETYQTSNYIIYSNYETNCNNQYYEKYVGVLGNFYLQGRSAYSNR